MKKKNLKTLEIRKEQVVSLTDRVFGGALPTTKQSTVNPTKAGDVCDLTAAVCPTNWFDC
ncbi:hypothetical protein KORDIASMS9_03037 [Kordia sp. SMS9]|uniref:hypothetical protein n=1 Tax=Kordia sp. SMS9 TaxID=2282170 RepID=UPI000E0DE426|nr:hypothetical protein [Kordia sp. SMS9]AXG70791.1 hypothetical protein KORDIASMS9_03037 [Kordia sp. SMS9]